MLRPTRITKHRRDTPLAAPFNLLEEHVRPDYILQQPNGPDCAPSCIIGSLMLSVEG